VHFSFTGFAVPFHGTGRSGKVNDGDNCEAAADVVVEAVPAVFEQFVIELAHDAGPDGPGWVLLYLTGRVLFLILLE